MSLIRLDRKRRVTIPKTVLRQARVYPIELYTDERIAKFERENAVPAELERRAARLAKSGRGNKQ